MREENREEREREGGNGLGQERERKREREREREREGEGGREMVYTRTDVQKRVDNWKEKKGENQIKESERS